MRTAFKMVKESAHFNQVSSNECFPIADAAAVLPLRTHGASAVDIQPRRAWQSERSSDRDGDHLLAPAERGRLLVLVQ
jgi:hypothetical protein